MGSATKYVPLTKEERERLPIANRMKCTMYWQIDGNNRRLVVKKPDAISVRHTHRP